jgi:hypothetical protein
MAHLPVPKKPDGTISLAYPFQQCGRRARRHRIAADATKLTVALGGVIIILLLGQLTPLASPAMPPVAPSTMDRFLFYTIQVIAAIVTIMSTLAYTINFEGKESRYATSARALNRLADRYALEVAKSPGDAMWLQKLEAWAREHVRKIESLLEDSRVLDVNHEFQIVDPL